MYGDVGVCYLTGRFQVDILFRQHVHIIPLLLKISNVNDKANDQETAESRSSDDYQLCLIHSLGNYEGDDWVMWERGLERFRGSVDSFSSQL